MMFGVWVKNKYRQMLIPRLNDGPHVPPVLAIAAVLKTEVAVTFSNPRSLKVGGAIHEWEQRSDVHGPPE